MNLKLKDGIKGYTEGRNKLISPEETIENAKRALNKLKPRVLDNLERIDHYNRVKIPVYVGKLTKEAKRYYQPPLTESCGKGINTSESKASALMELIERFSCYSFLQNKNNYKIKTHHEIHKQEKPKRIFEDLELSLPEEHRKNNKILKEFKEVPLEWTESYSLTENKKILFPLRLFHMFQLTNGFASGNSKEEAILQGICEVIERHQSTKIIKNQKKSPTIEPNSIKNPIAKTIISKIKKEDIKLFIKDFSQNLNIPTIGILAHDTKTNSKAIKNIATAGTHPNKQIALIRALIEIIEVRSNSIRRKEKQSHAAVFPCYKTLKEAKYLTKNQKKKKFKELPTYSNKNIKKEIQKTIKTLKTKGFKVIITETTHEKLDIPTVIVTIPKSKMRTTNNPKKILKLYKKQKKKQNKPTKQQLNNKTTTKPNNQEKNQKNHKTKINNNKNKNKKSKKLKKPTNQKNLNPQT
ncbi:MAG: Ribosomal protein S12 methylthiotransferase accessory factor YcaO [Candidatus Methanohalarchaeum thermophilum]|uniref:Ribosomal protein S12 methylthiotransferase accessory factor YcaO n=1 Tax=Methanohalarchaeum thermophilum TaxID=1903181 RepID=A0A1Q6DWF2_METT1|nr:MAG: Ribosomal protein S12 methylthiotransferase accessory factor YcaO [Candidatus Methanohalarchaeum thermophilum]